MKHIKRIAAAVLALCALLALTACGGLQEKVESKLWETAAPILVQGNMDLLYKGVCDENYLKLVNSTQEDCLPYYEENMALQAQAIMAAFEINDVNNNQSDRFIDIMKQVYAKADYTIGAASQVANGTKMTLASPPPKVNTVSARVRLRTNQVAITAKAGS